MKARTVFFRVIDSVDGETIDESFALDGVSKALTYLPCGKA